MSEIGDVEEVVHQEDVPNGLSKFSVIVVYGRHREGAGSNRFQVLLARDHLAENGTGDVALNVDCRFDERVIARSALIQGTWTPREREGPFPLAVGENFSITIACRLLSYQIVMNGVVIGAFRHRINISEVRSILVRGNAVTVSQLFINDAMQNAMPMNHQLPEPLPRHFVPQGHIVQLNFPASNLPEVLRNVDLEYSLYPTATLAPGVPAIPFSTPAGSVQTVPSMLPGGTVFGPGYSAIPAGQQGLGLSSWHVYPDMHQPPPPAPPMVGGYGAPAASGDYDMNTALEEYPYGWGHYNPLLHNPASNDTVTAGWGDDPSQQVPPPLYYGPPSPRQQQAPIGTPRSASRTNNHSSNWPMRSCRGAPVASGLAYFGPHHGYYDPTGSEWTMESDFSFPMPDNSPQGLECAMNMRFGPGFPRPDDGRFDREESPDNPRLSKKGAPACNVCERHCQSTDAETVDMSSTEQSDDAEGSDEPQENAEGSDPGGPPHQDDSVHSSHHQDGAPDFNDGNRTPEHLQNHRPRELPHMGHMGYGASLPPSSIFESEMTTPEHETVGEQGAEENSANMDSASSRKNNNEEKSGESHAADADSWDPPSFVNYFIRPSDSEYESTTPIERPNEARIGGRQTVNDLRAMLDGSQDEAMMYRQDPQEMQATGVEHGEAHTAVIHPARGRDSVSSAVPAVPSGPKRSRTPRIRVTEVQENALASAARYIQQPDELPYSTDTSENARGGDMAAPSRGQQRRSSARKNAGASDEQSQEDNRRHHD